jgi:NAD(P)-dependent dehydrogenase (short-subunit alcohol dehydrogenase family)
VTGAGRGLGRELALQLAARGDEVVATVRRAEDGEQLARPGLRVEVLDVAREDSVAAFTQRLAGRPVDVLVNNAGRQNRAGALDGLDLADVADTFLVNTLGPLRVTRALLEPLRAGTLRRVVHVTSRMGSFGEFDGANMYAYRASKAALNMFHRCLAEELGAEGFVCLALHPGWVRTDMGGAEAPLSAEESVAGMLRVIDGAGPEHNGAFLDHRGETLPW